MKRVQLQAPRRTAEYDDEAHVPATPLPQSKPSTHKPPAHAATWWRAMRVALAAYLSSIAYIMLRSGSEEWASIALGLAPPPQDEASRGRGGGGKRKYEYDWVNERWNEV